jgi:glycine/sarcosine/betaine reductase complex component A
MDPENQAQIQAIAEAEGTENTLVVLGAVDVEALEVAGETVTRGDPAYVGPLAGVQLGLPVFHIVEDEIRSQIDPSVYEQEVGFLELTLDFSAVPETMQRIRGDGTGG